MKLVFQVETLRARLADRDKQRQVKRNAANEVTDRESRQLVFNINALNRLIQNDEEETKALEEKGKSFLHIALTNYRRSVDTSAGVCSSLGRAMCSFGGYGVNAWVGDENENA